MSGTKRSTTNAGIQANTVTADVMAVGSHARATKVVKTGEANQELLAMIAQLRNSISAMPLAPPAKAALEEDIVNLDSAVADKDTPPDRVDGILRSIVGKLKMVGVLMSDAVIIAEPLKKIAGLFGVQCPW